jgi:hypothetical protein
VDSPLEGTGFELSVPRDTTNLSMSPLVGSRPTEKSERKRTDTRSVGPFPRGTDGSNPVPSSGESAPRGISPSHGEKEHDQDQGRSSIIRDHEREALDSNLGNPLFAIIEDTPARVAAR